MFNSVNVIGRGRVGSAVAARLEERGVELREDDAELVLLCVPDRAIAEVAGSICARGRGWRTSAARRRWRRSTRTRSGSRVHPLQTFTRSRGAEQLDGAWAAVTAENVEARAHGSELARHARPAAVRPRRRRRARSTTRARRSRRTTWSRSTAPPSRLFEDAGAPPEALVPLMTRTIENGFELTGPIARGDWAAVDAHLAALHDERPELEPMYRALAEATKP